MTDEKKSKKAHRMVIPPAIPACDRHEIEKTGTFCPGIDSGYPRRDAPI